jgi:hypothetical protein
LTCPSHIKSWPFGKPLSFDEADRLLREIDRELEENPPEELIRRIERMAARCAMLEAKLSKPKQPQKPRRRALKTIAAEARAIGATSVKTPDGFTYTISQAAELAPAGEQDPAEREIARLRALRGTR